MGMIGLAAILIPVVFSELRHWDVYVRPLPSMKRLYPNIQNKISYRMVLGANGEVIFDNQQLSGFWSVKQCPYEVLEKATDYFRVECAANGIKVSARGNLWHLRRQRKITHGIISVESSSPGVPNLVLATFRGRELSTKLKMP